MTAEIELVIRAGQVVTPTGLVEGDIGISGGKIISIGQAIGAAQTEINAQGRLVMPGGVDTHAHIEQMSGMGLWNADTFETATRSAAMGGTTSVISFAAQAKGQTLAQHGGRLRARATRGDD
jgi:dihydropyrimidinase